MDLGDRIGDVIILANTEGLTAHAASVEQRANTNGPEARPKPKPDKPGAAPVAAGGGKK